MAEVVPSELQDWDKIVELAGRDNEPARAQAAAMASKKQTFALVNLGQTILKSQQHTSQRLEALNVEIDKAANQSDRLSRRTYILTWVLAVATVVQAAAAVTLIFRARG